MTMVPRTTTMVPVIVDTLVPLELSLRNTMEIRSKKNKSVERIVFQHFTLQHDMNKLTHTNKV